MRTSTLAAISLGATTLVLWGCKGGEGDLTNIPKANAIPLATIQPGKDAEVIPFKVGNEWTYGLSARAASNVKDQTRSDLEAKFKIVAIEETPQGKKVMWEMTTNGKLTDRQSWLVNSKGMYQLGVGFPNFKLFSTPQPIVTFPIKPGQTFYWEGSGILSDGTVGKMEISSKILEPQEVDTEMGRLSAFPIESSQTFTSAARTGKGISSIYIAPGVGIVRLKQQEATNSAAVVQLLRLKSKNLQ